MLFFKIVVAFSVAFNQNHELLGKNGLKPANKYMERVYVGFTKNHVNKFESTFLNEAKIKYNLFINCPTLFWFFNWSQDIDQLLWWTSLIGNRTK